MERAFRILEHPSDLGVEARGTSLAEAFQNAAAGMMSVILDLSSVTPREKRLLEITAADCEQLLVRWLSEILYLYDGLRFASCDFAVTELSDTRLLAAVGGEVFSPDRHPTQIDVKAVTYHQLAVEENETGAVVRFFLDI